ncbi:hypothetical protein E2C01_070483 [Portunus trituberculatus]|uniref:Uncharacterized protein n=1 Tax=Portunus trituberculatus TaxID=210409 RepID=A0A5B7HU96_PORTR|nr:hypothetical protein [Portunus trituberculatus]
MTKFQGGTWWDSNLRMMSPRSHAHDLIHYARSSVCLDYNHPNLISRAVEAVPATGLPLYVFFGLSFEAGQRAHTGGWLLLLQLELQLCGTRRV